MRVLKAYQYLFYKLYKHYESSKYSRWWSDGKALASIIILEIMTIFSFTFYFQLFTGKSVNEFKHFNFILWLFVAAVSFINWYLFQYHNKWKNIVKKFDGVRRQNRLSDIAVWVVIFGMIFNLFFSIYMLNQSIH